MSRIHLALACAVATSLGADLFAQSSMVPLATFGTNGWLSPGTSGFLGTGNLERGFAYNPVTGNLILCSRAGGPNLRILNGATGADLGGLDVTGLAGGTFVVNMVDCAADGTIYACNLSTSITANFKVYKWLAEVPGVPSTVAYDALPNVSRAGDSFAVTGGSGGNPIKFAAAGSNTTVATPNSYFVVGTVDGSNTGTTYSGIAGTPTANNGYRLGLTFVDQNTLIGTQGAAALLTTFSGTTATLVASVGTSAAQRPLDYAVINGTPVLALIDTNSSIVSVYDISAPSSPLLLTSATTTSGALTGNTNGTGSVQWGAITGNTATLYAMSSNQGIQAFTVTVATPANNRSVGTGCGTPALALAATGAPILPSAISLDITNLPAASFAFFALGFTEIPGGVPLPIAPTCNQYVVPSSTNLVIPTTPGTASYPLNVPNTPSLAGLVFFSQGLSYDPVTGGLLSSNALRHYLQTF